MNNSFSIEEQFPEEAVDPVPLRERETKLLRLLEAIQAFGKEWSTLKDELFDGRLELLERMLSAESKKAEIDVSELYRLQGRINEVKRIMNITESGPRELAAIRKRLTPGDRAP